MRIRLIALMAVTASASLATADDTYNQAPIHYQTAAPTDRVAQLAKQLEQGKTDLQWDPQHGWLRSLLKALDLPIDSQTLVFSKTSLQFRRITPAHPRAIYFNDDIYVGWVPGGSVLELSAADPQLGAVFYTLAQSRAERPVIVRDKGECLSCHATSRTQRVPGFLVRSVFPTSNGQPDFRRGTLTSDHRTPLADRFGGWYVTGSHGKARHRGNVYIKSEDEEREDPLDREAGANLGQLPDPVNRAQYLAATSDIVALMLLEHQTQMHNFITQANYAARRALHHQQLMNKVLEEPQGHISKSTRRRIQSGAEELVDYMLFVDEHPLSSPVQGVGNFAAEFQRTGVADPRGRSLKQLDLQRRLLKHPCSYLIYSEAFLALPRPVLAHVRRRLDEILSGKDESEKYAHLNSSDRQAILEILESTHPMFRK